LGDESRRCREAGIPDTLLYRPKWRIGLEMYDRAVANGVTFEWMTFDEGYGINRIVAGIVGTGAAVWRVPRNDDGSKAR
jgi:hypothetical protein